MIDIHTHILPGVDDGPATLEESLEILKKASDDGVKTIVATPHLLEFPSENNWERIRNSFDSVKQAIRFKGFDIEIVLGAELFISHDLPEVIKQNREITINNSYVLLELPLHEIPLFTEQTIYELILQGIIPIIAHPERYLEIQQDRKKLSNLVDKGVFTQINSGSLIGKYGRAVQKTARMLLRENLIHIMGSDIHSVIKGSYPLIQGVNMAAEIVGLERAKAMTTSIPEGIMKGKNIEILPHRHIRGKAVENFFQKNLFFRKMFRLSKWIKSEQSSN